MGAPTLFNIVGQDGKTARRQGNTGEPAHSPDCRHDKTGRY
jgi:hypothetical protein